MKKLFWFNQFEGEFFEKRFVYDTGSPEVKSGVDDGGKVEKKTDIGEVKGLVLDESGAGKDKMKGEIELKKLTKEDLKKMKEIINHDAKHLADFLKMTELQGVIFSGEIPTDLVFEDPDFVTNLMEMIEPKMRKSVKDPKVIEDFLGVDEEGAIKLASVSLAAYFAENMQKANYDHLDKQLLENGEYEFEVKFDEKNEVVTVVKDEKGNVVEKPKDDEKVDSDEQKKLSEAEKTAERDAKAEMLQGQLGGVLDFLGFGAVDPKTKLTGYQKLAAGHPDMAAFAFILGMLGLDPFGDGTFTKRYEKTRGMLGEKGKFLDDLQVQAKASMGEYFEDIIPDEFRDMSKVFKSSKFEGLSDFKDGIKMEEGGVKLNKEFNRPEGDDVKIDLSAEGAMVMIPNKERFAAYVEGDDKLPGSIIAKGNVKFNDGILIVSSLPKGTIISNGAKVISESKVEEDIDEKSDEESSDEAVA